MAVVTQTIQDQVTELYIGFFNRAPDAAGFGYWCSEIAAGKKTASQIANDFALSAEFVSQYGGLQPTQQVIRAYTNVLDRTPLPNDPGVQYWVNELNNGTSIGTVVWQIVNAAFSYTGADPQKLSDGMLVRNKVTVGEYFAGVLASNDLVIAQTAFVGVTSNPASVAAKELELYAEVNTVHYTLQESFDIVEAGGSLADMYVLTNATANIGENLSVAEEIAANQVAQNIVNNAENSASLRLQVSYTLLDSLENIANAPSQVAAARSYALTDADIALGSNLTVANATSQLASAQGLVAGATNGSGLVLNATYTLSDTLANLAAAPVVLAGATSYSLTNPAGDLGVLTEAQADIVAGATDAADYTFALSYTLQESFDIVEAGGSLADMYVLTNATANIGENLSVAEEITANQVAQNIVNNAENSASLRLQASYTLLDSLENIAGAPSQVAAARSYALTDADIALGSNLTVANATVQLVSAQGLVSGATNGSGLVLNATYTLSDTLANLAAAPVVLAGATSYSLTNPAGDLGVLTEAQADIVAGATDAADYTFTVSFELTTRIDTIEGTPYDDVFEAPLGGGEADRNTLQPFDSLNGNGGTDTLNVDLAGNVTGVRALTDIEIVNITNTSGLGHSINLASAGQLENVSNFASSSDLTVSGLNVDTVDLTVENITGADTTFLFNTTTGIADTVDLAVIDVTGPDVDHAEITIDGVETINLDSTGLLTDSNTVHLNANAANTINITGGNDGETNLSIHGMEVASLINARTFTGDLEANLSVAGTLIGGLGNDTLGVNAGGYNVNISGHEGNDTITSSSGSDVLDGGAGNDVISSGDNNDTIYAGEGNNSVNAGDGADSITAGTGADTIVAGEGADTIDSGAGADSIVAGTGNDNITSGDGADRIFLGGGNDTVSAGGDNDYIEVDNEGVIGNESIDGGSGDDRIYFLDQGTLNANDSINGGTGLIDVLVAQAADLDGLVTNNVDNIEVLGVLGTLGEGTVDNIQVDNIDTAIEVVVLAESTGPAAATIGFNVGDSILDIEKQLGGTLTLQAGVPGAIEGDTLNIIDYNTQGPVEPNVDIFNNQTLNVVGFETLNINTGASRGVGQVQEIGILNLLADPNADVDVNIDSGDDVYIGQVNSDTAGLLTINFSALGVGEDATLLDTNSAGDVSILGGEGNDELYGDALNNNTIQGGAGDDLLVGGLDDDLIEGGEGADTIEGGAGRGNEILRGNAGDDIIFTLSEEYVTIEGGEGEDIIDNDFVANEAFIDGGTNDDFILMGNFLSENDSIDGGEGYDFLQVSSRVLTAASGGSAVLNVEELVTDATLQNMNVFTNNNFEAITQTNTTLTVLEANSVLDSLYLDDAAAASTTIVRQVVVAPARVAVPGVSLTVAADTVSTVAYTLTARDETGIALDFEENSISTVGVTVRADDLTLLSISGDNDANVVLRDAQQAFTVDASAFEDQVLPVARAAALTFTSTTDEDVTFVGGLNTGLTTVSITGDGNNNLTAGAGVTDFGIVGDGNNTINGGAGNLDVTITGDGNNVVVGPAGNAIITINGTGDNYVNGSNSNGDYTVSTGAGIDIIFGANGDINYITGGGDADILTGGAASNLFLNNLIADFAEGEFVTGGSVATDILSFAQSGTVSYVERTVVDIEMLALGNGVDDVTVLQGTGLEYVDGLEQVGSTFTMNYANIWFNDIAEASADDVNAAGEWNYTAGVLNGALTYFDQPTNSAVTITLYDVESGSREMRFGVVGHNLEGRVIETTDMTAVYTFANALDVGGSAHGAVVVTTGADLVVTDNGVAVTPDLRDGYDEAAIDTIDLTDVSAAAGITVTINAANTALQLAGSAIVGSTDADTDTILVLGDGVDLSNTAAQSNTWIDEIKLQGDATLRIDQNAILTDAALGSIVTMANAGIFTTLGEVATYELAAGANVVTVGAGGEGQTIDADSMLDGQSLTINNGVVPLLVDNLIGNLVSELATGDLDVTLGTVAGVDIINNSTGAMTIDADAMDSLSEIWLHGPSSGGVTVNDNEADIYNWTAGIVTVTLTDSADLIGIHGDDGTTIVNAAALTTSNLALAGDSDVTVNDLNTDLEMNQSVIADVTIGAAAPATVTVSGGTWTGDLTIDATAMADGETLVLTDGGFLLDLPTVTVTELKADLDANSAPGDVYLGTLDVTVAGTVAATVAIDTGSYTTSVTGAGNTNVVINATALLDEVAVAADLTLSAAAGYTGDITVTGLGADLLVDASVTTDSNVTIDTADAAGIQILTNNSVVDVAVNAELSAQGETLTVGGTGPFTVTNLIGSFNDMTTGSVATEVTLDRDGVVGALAINVTGTNANADLIVDTGNLAVGGLVQLAGSGDKVINQNGAAGNTSLRLQGSVGQINSGETTVNTATGNFTVDVTGTGVGDVAIDASGMGAANLLTIISTPGTGDANIAITGLGSADVEVNSGGDAFVGDVTITGAGEDLSDNSIVLGSGTNSVTFDGAALTAGDTVTGGTGSDTLVLTEGGDVGSATVSAIETIDVDYAAAGTFTTGAIEIAGTMEITAANSGTAPVAVDVAIDATLMTNAVLGGGLTIVDGAGDDVITGPVADAARAVTSVELTNGGDNLVVIGDAAVINGDALALDVTGFVIANDTLSLEIAGNSVSNGGFAVYSGGAFNQSTGEVLEVQSSTYSLGDLTNAAAVLAFLNAENVVSDVGANYASVVVYDGNGTAGLYVVRDTAGGAPSAWDAIELIGTVNAENNALIATNFI